jgi:hypothetical protein
MALSTGAVVGAISRVSRSLIDVGAVLGETDLAYVRPRDALDDLDVVTRSSPKTSGKKTVNLEHGECRSTGNYLFRHHTSLVSFDQPTRSGGKALSLRRLSDSPPQ